MLLSESFSIIDLRSFQSISCGGEEIIWVHCLETSAQRLHREREELMDITEFVANSIGHWRSQRSAHHLAFGHFEAVMSEIDIISLSEDDPAVLDLCKSYAIDPQTAVSPFRMSWEGQSDWEDSEVIKGTCVLVPIPNPDQVNCGKLLRDQGYAEEIAAVGDYAITEDGTFVLITAYDRAAAEEKIWFVNPNVRCRVSLIKTSAGTGVVTASFSSEIRQEIKK